MPHCTGSKYGSIAAPRRVRASRPRNRIGSGLVLSHLPSSGYLRSTVGELELKGEGGGDCGENWNTAPMVDERLRIGTIFILFDHDCDTRYSQNIDMVAYAYGPAGY